MILLILYLYHQKKMRRKKMGLSEWFFVIIALIGVFVFLWRRGFLDKIRR
jgi:drug/metabolite transporter (DMT)-like permease